jgi:hypothetical protein
VAQPRSFVIATALIVIVVGGFLLNRHQRGLQPIATTESASPGTAAVAPSPGAVVPTPTAPPRTAPDSTADLVAEPGAPVEPANAQDASPDYVYRAVPRPASSEVAADAGNEWLRAFEKEERDGSWAGPLEAEIRKSLDPEINLGRFYLANVECRATLCEIRLLARGSLQRAELDLFQTQIHQLPWAGRLSAALSSGISSPDGYESIWIFEKKANSAN